MFFFLPHRARKVSVCPHELNSQHRRQATRARTYRGTWFHLLNTDVWGATVVAYPEHFLLPSTEEVREEGDVLNGKR